MTSVPQPERPSFQPGYGISSDSEGLLGWDYLIEEITRSRNYWVVSVRPNGGPHAAPVWGVWVDGALYFGTNPASVKGRNLAADPRVVVHLESGDDVVILEGVVSVDPLASDLHARVVDAYAAKYDMEPAALPPADGWYTLRPAKALAWHENDYPRTATRFRP